MKRRLCLAALLVTLASCDLGPEARIGILLPPLPEAWRVAFPDLGCLLVCPGGDGVMRSTAIASWESGAVIPCGKSGNTPVLAWPLSPRDAGPDVMGPGILRPAGGTYPGSLVAQPGSPLLRLTWADGPAALVLVLLRSLGRDTSVFNAARLSETLGAAPDPWDFDLAAMAETIARGDFSVYDIDMLPCRDVCIEAGEGDWVLESPFRPAVRAAPDGSLFLPGVSLGAHTLFSLDPHGPVVGVSVGERETITIER